MVRTSTHLFNTGAQSDTDYRQIALIKDRCVCVLHWFCLTVLLPMFCVVFLIYSYWKMASMYQSTRAELYSILYKFPNTIQSCLFYKEVLNSFISIWSAYCTLNHFVPTWLLTSSRNQHPGQKHSELNLKNDPEPPAEKTVLFTAMDTLTLTASRKHIFKTLMVSVLSVTTAKLKPFYKSNWSFSQTKALLFKNHCKSLQANDATAK